ncbi:MAG: hypothetical protein ABIY55_16565 [Kofleriaceae bacterium]
MTNPWRSLAVLLAVISSYQAWRGCNAPRLPLVAECARPAPRSEAAPARPSPAHPRDAEAEPRASADTPRIYGIAIPPWATALLPAPGEDLRSYRDRMLPLAQLAIAPQRARVARSRDDLAHVLGLDPQQQAGLDATTRDAAQAIQDRLFNAALSGELNPASFKPMAAVTVARDVLDVIDRANKHFVTSLDDAQRTQLAHHPFDFGDYLLFSTRWEDAITGL